MYPAQIGKHNGKLRLLYECSPFAMIYDQAGGAATTGHQRILDIQTTELHQRVPIIIGNTKEIEIYERLVDEFKA